jgi:hypothetical protein
LELIKDVLDSGRGHEAKKSGLRDTWQELCTLYCTLPAYAYFFYDQWPG